ncbi:unnamed protein product, partial [Cochlearia groenlandica]
MECNKEEAIRAMDIAKKKVSETDYNGAKKFATKAQNLYPELDGLKQVLMLIDVYISADDKIDGKEPDWYGVLGVDPLADIETVKKQYRKLALLLHPDKNKCEGAEGAFKLVSEAWSLLSDKVKRIGFDQKRKLKTQPPKEKKQPPTPENPSNKASSNRSRTGKAKSSKPTPKVSTFWTMCNRCGTRHEYVRVYYLNKTVLCKNCLGPFHATEKENTPQATNKNTPKEAAEGSGSSDFA